MSPLLDNCNQIKEGAELKVDIISCLYNHSVSLCIRLFVVIDLLDILANTITSK